MIQHMYDLRFLGRYDFQNTASSTLMIFSAKLLTCAPFLPSTQQKLLKENIEFNTVANVKIKKCQISWKWLVVERTGVKFGTRRY